jgi:hypothetical protein
MSGRDDMRKMMALLEAEEEQEEANAKESEKKRKVQEAKNTQKKQEKIRLLQEKAAAAKKGQQATRQDVVGKARKDEQISTKVESHSDTLMHIASEESRTTVDADMVAANSTKSVDSLPSPSQTNTSTRSTESHNVTDTAPETPVEPTGDAAVAPNETDPQPVLNALDQLAAVDVDMGAISSTTSVDSPLTPSQTNASTPSTESTDVTDIAPGTTRENPVDLTGNATTDKTTNRTDPQVDVNMGTTSNSKSADGPPIPFQTHVSTERLNLGATAPETPERPVDLTGDAATDNAPGQPAAVDVDMGATSSTKSVDGPSIPSQTDSSTRSEQPINVSNIAWDFRIPY